MIKLKGPPTDLPTHFTSSPGTAQSSHNPPAGQQVCPKGPAQGSGKTSGTGEEVGGSCLEAGNEWANYVVSNLQKHTRLISF